MFPVYPGLNSAVFLEYRTVKACLIPDSWQYANECCLQSEGDFSAFTAGSALIFLKAKKLTQRKYYSAKRAEDTRFDFISTSHVVMHQSSIFQFDEN